MLIIYNVGIWLYYTGITIASLFNKKARLWVKGRKNIFGNIQSKINKGDKIAWFHCASLGEFEQGRSVLEKFHEEFKGYKILLTFFSPSGFEIRKNYELADYVFYLPMDTHKNARKFINIVNPDIVFFVKYEFWFNYLRILSNKNIPVMVFSAIFRKNQHFFKWYGEWFRKELRKISCICLQNIESFNLLQSINVKNIIVSGDTRFDRVFQIRETSRTFPFVEKFKRDELLIMAGSTWPLDEDLICKFINSNSYNIKYIIAPHNVNKENILMLEKKIEGKSIKFSELNENNVDSSNILIVDGIGYLSHLYKYATIAYIGGGFGKGIHNTLEAATFGLPIIFGPNYQKFQEAKDLIEKGAAFSIGNEKEFFEKMELLIKDKQLLSVCSGISKNYIVEKKGATEINIQKIKELLGK